MKFLSLQTCYTFVVLCGCGPDSSGVYSTGREDGTRSPAVRAAQISRPGDTGSTRPSGHRDQLIEDSEDVLSHQLTFH